MPEPLTNSLATVGLRVLIKSECEIKTLCIFAKPQFELAPTDRQAAKR